MKESKNSTHVFANPREQKKKYTPMKLEYLKFAKNDDIICASGFSGGDRLGDDRDDWFNSSEQA